MFIGTLPPASNKATWIVNYELRDDDTNELIDLSSVDEIKIVVRDRGSQVLSGTLTGGQITVLDTGVFRWEFTPQQMGSLCAKTYEVGCIITDDGQTVQLVIGTLPILDGIVT